MRLSSASTFRRTASGLCLLVGPAMLLVATIVDPAAGEGEGRDSLQALREDPDMAQLATALQIWGSSGSCTSSAGAGSSWRTSAARWRWWG